MDSQEFIKQLNKVQELMQKECYREAIVIINKLKEIDKNSNINYSLTHKLYQLDSNSRSLYNQKIILKNINNLSKEKDSITFWDLAIFLKEKNGLELNFDILRREIEILILRNLLSCKIDGEKLIF